MNNDVPTVLKKIIATKHQEVAERQSNVSLDDLKGRCEAQSSIRPFYQSLHQRVVAQRSAVIAEVKRASPSKGIIRDPFHPVDIALAYAQSGAACLSVLTDVEYFQGADDYLVQARAAVDLPVLRKDFMVDPYQIYESRALGADCILLIVAALSDERLRTLYDLTMQLGMDCLVEVHTAEEFERALPLAPAMLGINNRDLHTFETSLDTTQALLARRDQLPESSLVITESGIHTPADVDRMRALGVYGFLVGEAFMRADDPGVALTELFGDYL